MTQAPSLRQGLREDEVPRVDLEPSRSLNLGPHDDQRIRARLLLTLLLTGTALGIVPPAQAATGNPRSQEYSAESAEGETFRIPIKVKWESGGKILVYYNRGGDNAGEVWLYPYEGNPHQQFRRFSREGEPLDDPGSLKDSNTALDNGKQISAGEIISDAGETTRFEVEVKVNGEDVSARVIQ